MKGREGYTPMRAGEWVKTGLLRLCDLSFHFVGIAGSHRASGKEALQLSQIRGCRTELRAPGHKGAIAQQSGAYVEGEARGRTGRMASTC